MKKKVTMTIDEKNYQILFDHLFPGDDDEHGAIIAVGVSETNTELRLLAREVILARDDIDYVPGGRGYKAFTAQFVAEKSDYCLENELGYISVHNHSGTDYVRFSGDDDASHKRCYPSLLDITGGPVGALVFAENAVAGEVWTNEGVYEMDHLTVVGSQVKKMYSEPSQIKEITNPVYDRHAKLFGDAGQAILSNLKVGIIGLGGGGSLINEWLSKLGVSKIVAIDFDKAESSNLPRIVGATRWDAQAWLKSSKYSWIQNLGKRFAKHKVKIAKRVAKKANPNIVFDAIVGDITDEITALRVKDADFIFLASDTIKSRNVFNALLHQYLIPGAQVGAKIRVHPDTKEVTEIFTVGRIVLPYRCGGCLSCNGWIPSARLQQELISEEERNAQRYVDDENITEPSVITLNVLSASQVINDFMMMFTGLYDQQKPLPYMMNYLLDREQIINEPRTEDDCIHCSVNKKSRFAKGDRKKLPCRRLSS